MGTPLPAARSTRWVNDLSELPKGAVSRVDSALYLSVLIQGIEYLCPNPDIWFYTSNKYLFVDTLRKKLASLVEGS